MSNLENMLHSHDPETVKLALTVMGYKEDEESFNTVSYQLRSNFGLLLYIVYDNGGFGGEAYIFDNLSLYNFGKNQDIRLKL
jgi:hypothetical protein